MFEKIRYRLENDIFLRNIVIAISVMLIVVCLTTISLSVFTRHGQKHKVPNFSGMTLLQAENAAKQLELNLEIIDSIYVPTAAKGVILEQYPKPDNVIKSKRRIFLTVNTFKPKVVAMPYVAGFSLRQAKNKLIGSGFTIEKLIYVDDIATNNVIEQKYNGKLVNPNSNITGEVSTGVVLTVGLNPIDADPTVPGIVGLSVEQAKNRLWEYGFNVGDIELDSNISYENVDEARVYAQSLPKSSRVMYGRTIGMKVTLDKDKVNKGLADSEVASKRQFEIEQIRQDSAESAEKLNPINTIEIDEQ